LLSKLAEIDLFLRKIGPKTSDFSNFSENVLDVFFVSLKKPNLRFHFGGGIGSYFKFSPFYAHFGGF